MNIVMTIMAGGCHPVQVVVKSEDGLWVAKTTEAPYVEARSDTFNGAIEKVGQRYAHSADIAA
jgi:hypothetical protein